MDLFLLLAVYVALAILGLLLRREAPGVALFLMFVLVAFTLGELA